MGGGARMGGWGWTRCMGEREGEREGQDKGGECERAKA